MSRESMGLPPVVLKYLRDHSVTETAEQVELREYTAGMEEAAMQISPEQGSFMQFMARLTNAKRCIEVGVFTGYSSLSVALGLPDDGLIKAFDISEKWTSIGQKYWERAGVARKIDLKIGPATEGLQSLIDNGEAGTYDFAFIDADKTNYQHYYENCLTLLKPGGLILIDNVLWSGNVADPDDNDEDTIAIRNINSHVAQDSRVARCMLPLSDGVTMVLKK